MIALASWLGGVGKEVLVERILYRDRVSFKCGDSLPVGIVTLHFWNLLALLHNKSINVSKKLLGYVTLGDTNMAGVNVADANNGG